MPSFRRRLRKLPKTTSIELRDRLQKAKSIDLRETLSQIRPDHEYITGVNSKNLEYYQDKLSPVLHHSYHSNSPYGLRPPVSLKNIIDVPINTVLNLNVRPGEPYFVLWFNISSYFPLVAACLGPLANMISVVALIEHWTVDSHEVNAIRAMNGVALGFGILGNISLLMNFSGTVRYLISQCVSILSWFCASMILIGAVVVTNHNCREETEICNETEGFFYVIFTSVFYFCCSCILLVNFLGYKLNKYPATFNLDHKQRTLMLFTILFAMWSVVGSVCMTHLIEGGGYGEMLYYCIVSFLTIGLGDIVPQSPGGKVMVLALSFGGVMLMGLIVATLRSVIISSAGPAVFWHKIELERLKLVHKLEQEGKTLTPEKAFHKMRVIRRRVKAHQMNKSLLITMIVFMGFWLVGAAVFHAIEGWSYFNSVYFCFLCLLTIGYGDFAPKTSLGRVFFVSWAIGAVPLMTILVSNFGDKLYDAFNGVSHAFTKWLYEEDPEYLKKRTKKKDTKECDSNSTSPSSSTSQIVRNEEMEEDIEIGSLEEEEEEEEEELEELEHRENHTTKTLTADTDQYIPREYTISRIEEKKIMHEQLLQFLDKLKPLIADSIENTSKKYTHTQWNELLVSLNEDNVDSDIQKKLPMDGFWLGEMSPLRLPLKEPNYFILRIYFKIESCLRELVEREIQDLAELRGEIEQEEDNSNSTALSSQKVTFAK
ncbi:uncharacterized protein SPAPADRAFT_155809 [Spathaspora passalidarum NRRL Y-27907]|uniref:Potassium channel domain-containing protein n=1 Tax=Spathaspora passalidarum (strain NRRL Y-27907 / 11-Y1) TaxID=619300 RepID=G3ASK4_SPAPN|nr:uncharacterized protein SPAPADRAFT_155809 [Spathaspora passalidarum NRRL Y-27907]EGW30690.1 hypothetical protein SPAPADRAFT_155809 [Spathaspora passalidarum NRRL Y-27907]